MNLGALTGAGDGSFGVYVQSNGLDGQGDGDAGGTAPTLILSSNAPVFVGGDLSVGLLGLAVGGAGHKGSDGDFFSGGGDGGLGGAGGAVTITGNGAIGTSGVNSYGVAGFSAGGQSGDGGNAGTFDGAGSGASGGNGGAVAIDGSFQITTSGDQGAGIVARSYGGAARAAPAT